MLFTVKSKAFLDLPNDVFLSPDGKFLIAIDAGEGDFDADRISIAGTEFGENPKELFFAYEKKKGKWTLVPTARL